MRPLTIAALVLALAVMAGCGGGDAEEEQGGYQGNVYVSPAPTGCPSLAPGACK